MKYEFYLSESENQDEMERELKIKMYMISFNWFIFSTDDQIEKMVALFPNGMKVTMDSPNQEVDDELVKICNILTKEQMKKIPAYWQYEKLYDWYVQYIKKVN